MRNLGFFGRLISHVHIRLLPKQQFIPSIPPVLVSAGDAIVFKLLGYFTTGQRC